MRVSHFLSNRHMKCLLSVAKKHHMFMIKAFLCYSLLLITDCLSPYSACSALNDQSTFSLHVPDFFVLRVYNSIHCSVSYCNKPIIRFQSVLACNPVQCFFPFKQNILHSFLMFSLPILSNLVATFLYAEVSPRQPVTCWRAFNLWPSFHCVVSL
jgi:hypothetical protein